jgi:hypothetical protein
MKFELLQKISPSNVISKVFLKCVLNEIMKMMVKKRQTGYSFVAYVRFGPYGGCSDEVPPIHFFQA